MADRDSRTNAGAMRGPLEYVMTKPLVTIRAKVKCGSSYFHLLRQTYPSITTRALLSESLLCLSPIFARCDTRQFIAPQRVSELLGTTASTPFPRLESRTTSTHHPKTSRNLVLPS